MKMLRLMSKCSMAGFLENNGGKIAQISYPISAGLSLILGLLIILSLIFAKVIKGYLDTHEGSSGKAMSLSR